jgi:F-type H+-transporting ATPase subunit delta
MKTAKEVKSEEKYLFRLCFIDGSLDANRVRSVVQGILGSKRRGSLALAGEFQRLVSLNQSQRTARVETATPLPADLRANVEENLSQTYGPDLNTSFSDDATLIGGMRIKVGSYVYDGSVRGRLAALENSF